MWRKGGGGEKRRGEDGREKRVGDVEEGEGREREGEM